MSTITFRLREKLSPEQQEAALRRVRQLPGVNRAESFLPASPLPSLRRLSFCQVDDGVAAKKVLEELEDLPEVEDAAFPAERGLVEQRQGEKIN